MNPAESPNLPPTPSGSPGGAEPSVLDWLLSLLRGKPIPIPGAESAEQKTDTGLPEAPRAVGPTQAPAPAPYQTTPPDWMPAPVPVGQPTVVELRIRAPHLRLPVALLLAFVAQYGLERRAGTIVPSLVLYAIAVGIAGWAVWAGDIPFETLLASKSEFRPLSFRPIYLAAAVVLSALTLLASGDDTFKTSTLVFWFGAIVCIMLTFWEGDISLRAIAAKVRKWVSAPNIHVSLDAWALAFLLVFAVSAWFRFASLSSVPPEMVSDHAEKLLDVVDVLNGKYSIFFPRNTGREAIQFYLAAATVQLLGTGVSYLTLKIGTALAGLLTLPFLYLFGKEVGGRKVGLVAMALAGFAYWPNVISRVGLRFPLYPLFAAPALYFLARGLRRRSRNDLLWCGLFVGLGLHGYTPARAIPIAVAVGVGIYMLYRSSRGHRWAAFTWLLGAGVVGLVVLLPLVRVAIDMPDIFLFRTLTRIGTTERPLPGSVVVIFLSNLWNALRMVAWDNGEVWVNSIPNRPALDWISAALFHIGAAMLIIRAIRKRNWVDAFALISIPILMLPSILSLAFPSENPATNRAAGAIVPIFVVAALPLSALPDWAAQWWGRARARWSAAAAVLVVILAAAALNYRLVFVEYADQYRRSAWNTSVMGEVIKGFAESVGSYDTAHVVAYPYWVDTRMPAIVAGRPTVDYAIWPQDLDTLAGEKRAQLFILNPKDAEGISRLKLLFPDGTFSKYTSPLEGKDFLIYFVPAKAGIEVNPTPQP